MRHSDTVYLLDASIYIFQAWFGIPDRFHDRAGRPMNAVYGYLKTLLAQLSDLKPRYGLAAFDESLFSGFRHSLYEPYKANRALPDDALAWQLTVCRQLTERAGLTCVGDAVYEADDWLALGAQLARGAQRPVVVLTRDKDLAQLVGEGDQWWDWTANVQRDRAQLCEHWQVAPEQIPDLLALMGDSADNIPGIRGVGAKSAQALVAHFGQLETLFADLDAVLTLPVRGAKRLHGALEGAEEDAFLYRELIRLHPPPSDLTIEDLACAPFDADAVLTYLEDVDLGAPFQNLVKRYAG